MKERLYSTSLNHPILVVLITLLLVAAAASGMKNLVFKSDYRIFFGSENPQLNAYEDMQRIYNKVDNVAFILAPKNQNVFTPEILSEVHWLTHEAWQTPYSTRVDSITNYQHTEAEEDDLLVEDLVLEPDTLTEKDMPRLKEIALAEPILLNKLISPSGHVTVVNVTVQLPGIDPTAETPEVAEYARALARQLQERNPDMEIHLSGIAMLNNSFVEASKKDSATLIPLMFGVVILAMIFLLRTISGTIATFFVIICTLSSTMGLVGWGGFFLSGPSASAPTMIMTLAVADCVHILTTFFYEMRQGMEKRAALLESLRINFKPIFLTSVTTAIGFLSLTFSDSPPFQHLGIFVALGMTLAFLFSIVFFPALLMLLPVRVKAKKSSRDNLMEHISTFVIGNRKFLLPIMTVIMVGLIAFAPQNTLNDDFIEYFDQRVVFRQATDFMQDNLSGMTSQEISIDSGTSGGINDPKFLNTIENFSIWLRGQPETDHVNILTDTIKRLNKNMHGDDPSYYRIPASRELSAQYLLLYEMSLPYGLDLNNQINTDKSSIRVIGTFKNIDSIKQIDIEERIKRWFTENGPEYEIMIASPNLMFAHISQRNVKSMLQGTALALLLISVLLGLALRSRRYAFISLPPNLAPAAMGFGVWFLMDGQIGIANSVIAGMTLGIVVDDTIHFLTKYHYARNERGKSSIDAVHYAFASVGQALWVTTLVLVAGFMILAQSSFKVNADMGLLTAITILIALIVDFLFLPPLLMKLDKNTQGEEAKGETYETA